MSIIYNVKGVIINIGLLKLLKLSRIMIIFEVHAVTFILKRAQLNVEVIKLLPIPIKIVSNKCVRENNVNNDELKLDYSE